MGREIKFRAFHNRKMYFFNLVSYMIHTEEWQESHCPNDAVDTLMQYTGLRDKNGTEIYEGDIVREKIGFGTESRTPKNKPHVFALGVVSWGERGWVISHELNNEHYWDAVRGNATDWYRVHYGWESCEVIGNIYENADLLSNTVSE